MWRRFQNLPNGKKLSKVTLEDFGQDDFKIFFTTKTTQKSSARIFQNKTPMKLSYGFHKAFKSNLKKEFHSYIINNKEVILLVGSVECIDNSMSSVALVSLSDCGGCYFDAEFSNEDENLCTGSVVKLLSFERKEETRLSKHSTDENEGQFHRVLLVHEYSNLGIIDFSLEECEGHDDSDVGEEDIENENNDSEEDKGSHSEEEDEESQSETVDGNQASLRDIVRARMGEIAESPIESLGRLDVLPIYARLYLRSFPPIKKRRRFEILDPESSSWYRLYVLNERKLPNDVFDMAFRRRFRLPHGLYMEFLEEIKRENLFPHFGLIPIEKRVCGVKGKPIELLLMSSLAYLAGTSSHWASSDNTFISIPVIRKFFDEFVKVGSTYWFSREVRIPNDEELQWNLGAFASAGLPGCFCCSDGVHIRLWSCSHNLKHSCTGKEKYPTIAFNVSVTYDMLIISVSNGLKGAWNDILQAQYDDFMLDLRRNDVFPDKTFQIQKLDGSIETVHKLWSLVDGGYPNWDCLMYGPPGSIPIDNVLCRWMESIRKVVECKFIHYKWTMTNRIISRCVWSFETNFSSP